MTSRVIAMRRIASSHSLSRSATHLASSRAKGPIFGVAKSAEALTPPGSRALSSFLLQNCQYCSPNEQRKHALNSFEWKRWKHGGKKGKKGNAPAPKASEEAEEVGDEDPFEDDEDGDGDDEPEEPSLTDPNEVKEKMMKVVQKFQDSLKSIRGGDPTPDLFDDVQVNAYGEMTPLMSVAQVVIVSATMAQVNCFDPSVAKEVSKAIQMTLGLNPDMEEGGVLNVSIPRVSLETRQATAKQLNKLAESCRQRIRKLRRKAMDKVKQGKDGKIPGVSKDDAFANAKAIDGVTDEINSTIKKLADEKLDAVMNS